MGVENVAAKENVRLFLAEDSQRQDRRVHLPLRIQVILIAVLLNAYLGCTRSPVSERKIEFPFEHPAAEEARKLFLTLEVYSEEDYRGLSRRDRYLWDVKWFEVEVMNGGVDQYFHNSAGDHSVECLEALKAIGAKDSYALLKQAIDLFPQGQPSTHREVRQKQLRELAGAKYIDDLLSGEIEVDLYQHMLDYYRKADPKK